MITFVNRNKSKTKTMKTETLHFQRTGETLETKKLKSRKAADNFIEKGKKQGINRKLVHFRAKEYYVTIK